MGESYFSSPPPTQELIPWEGTTHKHQHTYTRAHTAWHLQYTTQLHTYAH